jgi:hypothetical protein
MQEFFKSTIISKYIKQLLAKSPLPIYRVIYEKEDMIEGCLYSYKGLVLRCTKSGIRLAFGEDKDTIMSDFKYRCGTLATGEWRDGWHAFCQTKRESYVKAIREACLDDSTEKQNAKFAHYLDCEAHTDVWRELFPTYNLTNEKE